MKGFSSKISTFIINAYSFFYFSLFITDYSFIYKNGFNNISGFTGLFLFLLIIRWLLDKTTFHQLLIFEGFRRLAKLNDRTLLIIFFFLIAFAISALGIARHLSLSSTTFDMGLFDQALWNTLKGDTLFSSIKGNINLLGDHFEPALFLLVPFYALWPHAFTLIVVQALLLAASLFPLYLIAKDKLQARLLVFAFLFSFALSKALRGVGLSDFHLEGFIVPVSFLSFYFLIKRRNWLFALTILFLLACKETAVFIVFAFGLYSLFPLKRPRAGLLLIAVAVIFWIIETKFIIPFFNAGNAGFFYYERMPFGSTYGENVQFIFKNPLNFLKFIFMPQKLEYCLMLLGLAGYFSIFAAFEYVLIILPSIPILLGGTRLSGYYQLSSHYVGAVLPFVYISAVYGLSKLLESIKKRNLFLQKVPLEKARVFLGIYLMVIALFFYGKTDAYKFRKFMDGIKANQAFQKLSCLATIPENATVSATANLVPHIAHRKYIFEWNPQNDISLATDYIVIDLDFLGYLPECERGKIPDFFARAANKGYREVFVNSQRSFFMLFKPDSDRSKVEGYRLQTGK